MKKFIILMMLILCSLSLFACNNDQNPPSNEEHVHTPGAWVTIKEPSCQDGEQCQFCASCGTVLQTMPIAATGIHKEIIENAVEATCINTGHTEGKHCITCGKIFVAQIEIPKTSHSYDNSQDETCNVCGFLRDISCEHSDVTVLPAKSPTCTATGVTEGRVCNICKDVIQAQQILYALGHKESDWIIERMPSESADGYKYKQCSTCNEKTREEIIPFIGNSSLAYEVNPDGQTCTITGIGSFDGTVLVIPEYFRGYKVTNIADRAFYECTQLTEINLPETIISIGTRAFYGCTGITEITIPASVTSIGTQIFYKCDKLSTVYYNSTYCYGTWGNTNAFLNTSSITKVIFGGKFVPDFILYGCSNILEVVVLNGVQRIGEHSFDKCSSLKNVIIEGDITRIGQCAFGYCTSLKSLSLYGSIGEIDGTAFHDCEIESVYISSMDDWYQTGFADYHSNPMFAGAQLYENNNLVTSVSIPSNASDISYMFIGCESIERVTLPNNIATIGNYAFYCCSNLMEINLPDSVTIIGSNAFGGCISLESIEIPDSVRSIGNSVFYSCIRLKGIEIPDSVTSIGTYAFEGCTSLESIEIPDYVISVGSYTFSACTSLKNVRISNSVTSIGSGAFYYCTSLESIEVPGSVVTIGSCAFQGCSSLKDVLITNSVTNIGDSAFEGCTSLESIKIPNSVTVISSDAFNDCESLESIEIPNSVTNIKSLAFFYCTSLTSVIIPNSVTSIDNAAFCGCTSLMSITFEGTVEQWNNISRESSWNSYTGNYTIYCTDGTIAKDGTIAYN